MPSVGGLMTDSFIPSWRSAFLPASMYKVPSDTYFTWKITGFSTETACAGVCAIAGPTKTHATRQASVASAKSSAAVFRILASATVLVAAVARLGAIAIAVDAAMLVVRLGLMVRCCRMAIDAGEAGVVRGNLMAIVAGWRIRFMVRDREEIGVIERGSEPGCRRVAGVAGRRITSRNVVGHRAAQ